MIETPRDEIQMDFFGNVQKMKKFSEDLRKIENLNPDTNSSEIMKLYGLAFEWTSSLYKKGEIILSADSFTDKEYLRSTHIEVNNGSITVSFPKEEILRIEIVQEESILIPGTKNIGLFKTKIILKDGSEVFIYPTGSLTIPEGQNTVTIHENVGLIVEFNQGETISQELYLLSNDQQEVSAKAVISFYKGN